MKLSPQIFGVSSVTVEHPVMLPMYDASPSRGLVSDVHGGLLALASTQALDSVTPVNVGTGVGKMIFVINAGASTVGTFTVTGSAVDRNTGVVTPNAVSSVTVSGLSTDNTSLDANGNYVRKFSRGYITNMWFKGSAVVETTDLDISDMDVYHCSFEQFNDSPKLTLTTFDANLLATNANGKFDSYLYTVEVDGSEVDIVNRASLNLGTPIANRYYRLRRGDIDTLLVGTTDGVYVEVYYANSPVYIEDVTIKVWANKMTSLRIQP